MHPTDLVALEELKRLKYRYLRSLDGKDWEAFAETLTDDVEAVYGERLAFRGRAEVLAYMSGTLGEGIITVHQCHHPDIEIDGDEATGRWSLEDTVLVPEHRFVLKGVAEYDDRYRRGGDGRWRIAATAYRRVYEATMSMDDLPSLKLG